MKSEDRRNLGLFNLPLLKLLSRVYAADAVLILKTGRFDLFLKADGFGQPFEIILGQQDAMGNVSGEHYKRRILMDENGKQIENRWTHVGKARSG